MQLYRYFALMLVTVLCATPAVATEVSGDQSGTWTLDQSPYELVGDVRVPPGETLVIEPGVVVNALGHYKLAVEQATLLAIGTADQPIIMTAADHGMGWRGVRLEQADDGSTISYCIIEYAKGSGEFPEVRGGAVLCKGCSPTISHNELRFNYSRNGNYNGTGAGVTTWNSSAIVVNNNIHDNISDSGGGICCIEDGTPLIAWNIIADNDGYYAGGGIYIAAWTTPTVENNIIIGNWAANWGGGGINSWGSGSHEIPCIIRNNVIAQNTTTASGNACGGGGIYCRYDRCILINNVIADNHANQGGGIYVLNQGYDWPQVSNTIIWGNTAPEGSQIYLYPDTESVLYVQYSDIEGGWTGEGDGNIDADPLFLDPNSGDYHMTELSPCIDTGDPNFVPDPDETDIDGQPRVWDGDDDGEALVDMGADEFDSYCHGDLNGDRDVNLADLAQLLSSYGETSGMTYEDGDIDGDGDVDLADLAELLAVYGTTCP